MTEGRRPEPVVSEHQDGGEYISSAVSNAGLRRKNCCSLTDHLRERTQKAPFPTLFYTREE